MKSKPAKAVNWLDSTRRSLQASIPEASECASYVTERLSALLLDRLPREIAVEILELLPEEAARNAGLYLHTDISSDSSVAFPAFVDRARHVLGMTDLLDSPRYADSEERYSELCEQVADAFLWAVLQEVPPELKHRMSAHLPSDLRCRMNLYSGFSDDAKVA